MDYSETLSPTIQDLVIFGLNNQRYAIPVTHIVQIIEMVTITPIPQMNAVVTGLINVRGASVPVIDMRRYLKQPEVSLHLHTPIILVHTSNADNEQLLGLIVDEVTDVIQVLHNTMTQLPAILPETLHNAPFVQGVFHTNYGMVILLDLENFFSAAQCVPSSLTEPALSDEKAILEYAL